MASLHRALRPPLLAILAAAATMPGCDEDGPSGICATCGPDEVCVQYFDGPCGVFLTECQQRHPTCSTGTACTTDCDLQQCNRGDSQPPLTTCFSGGCPDEDPAALHCYGS